MSEKTLTTQERHYIYVRALEMLRNEIGEGENTFICPNLEMLCEDLHDLNVDVKYAFPEFYEQKPDPVYAAPTDEWWPQTEAGNNERIKALEKAIELTQETP